MILYLRPLLQCVDYKEVLMTGSLIVALFPMPLLITFKKIKVFKGLNISARQSSCLQMF
jgi:hypothetical protein